MSIVTVDTIVSRDPCYKKEDGSIDVDRVESIIGVGKEHAECVYLPIPYIDRLWILLHTDTLGSERYVRFSEECLSRALIENVSSCGIPFVEGWARDWVQGRVREDSVLSVFDQYCDPCKVGPLVCWS